MIWMKGYYFGKPRFVRTAAGKRIGLGFLSLAGVLEAGMSEWAKELLPILQKPAFGKPCNGCGYCCKEEACWISTTLLESKVAPCIALEHDGERYFCGMLRNPSHYLGLKFDGNAILQPMIFAALGVGKGCDAD